MPPKAIKSKPIKYVYFLSEKDLLKDANENTRTALLGIKGLSIFKLQQMNGATPPGFIITTSACKYFHKHHKLPLILEQQIEVGIGKIEKSVQKKFGDAKNPLLVSVRSSPAVLMPGLMDTILNIGLNDVAVEGLAQASGNERFAFDCYRRFIRMYGNAVLPVERRSYEIALSKKKAELGLKGDIDFEAGHLREIVETFKEITLRQSGQHIPQEPFKQLSMAIEGLFRSWKSDRAEYYREMHNIPDTQGTAVLVQAMVFGNYGEDSGTGVVCTRNPSTGQNQLYGEYIMNAQGEDIVWRGRTPSPLTELGETKPVLYAQLQNISRQLERQFREVVDFEFTMEKGQIYILQASHGKREPYAKLKMAIDMVNEGLITKKEAVKRVTNADIEILLRPIPDPLAKRKVIAKGSSLCKGAVSGRAVFSANDAVRFSEKEKTDIIFVKDFFLPEDIAGMKAAKRFVMIKHIIVSDTAMAARDMGKYYIFDCQDMKISSDNKYCLCGKKRIKTGDWITLDCTTGEILEGHIPLVKPKPTAEIIEFRKWMKEYGD